MARNSQFQPEPFSHLRSELTSADEPTAVPLGPIRSGAIADEQAKIVQETAPIAEAYRQARDMAVKLLVFATVMDNEITEGSKNGSVESWATVVRPRSDEFIWDYRPGVVQLTGRLRDTFGLIDPSLSDTNLHKDFFGPKDIIDIAKGLQRVLDDLAAKMVEEASQL